MKTGIVIEITGKDAIVMKNGGEFITLPARKRPAVPIRRFLAAAAACLCLAVSGGGYHYYYAQAALISVDVNPSIELSVNRQDRVTSTAALNEDGKALLTGIRLTGMECGEAVRELLQAESSGQYPADHKNVVVTVYSTRQQIMRLPPALRMAARNTGL